MFFSKPKYRDDDLGEFTFSGGIWNAQTTLTSNEKLFISVSGDKTSLNSESLNQAKHILSHIEKYIDKAKNYIDDKGISGFIEGNGSVILDGFFSHEERGRFDLDFGLLNSDDASIVVHFKNDEPFDISSGD